MSNQHQLDTMAQIAALTPEEFGRMLPDFIAWYEFSQIAQRTEGIKTTGFTWFDDGQPGEISVIAITDAATGERHEFINTELEGGAA